MKLLNSIDEKEIGSFDIVTFLFVFAVFLDFC